MELESLASPPLLPWELIERIVSHSVYDCNEPSGTQNLESIRNFSLTCRQLYPHSLCVLVTHVTFSSRDKIFDFCDFLQAKPHLRPFVRSLTAHPDDFAPVPLLRILPDLREIRFIVPPRPYRDAPIHTVLNQSNLKSSQLLSTRVQTLQLYGVSFKTSLQFLQVLSAFTSITHLVCSDVHIAEEGDKAPLDVAKRRLFPRLRLLTLAVKYESYPPRSDKYHAPYVGTLLLDSGFVQSTVERLTSTVREMPRTSGIPSRFDWSRLQFLTLDLWSSAPGEITSCVEFLKDFHRLALKEVIVKVHAERDLLSVTTHLTYHANLYEELEHTLLRFSQGRLVWIMTVFPTGENSFWIQDLGRRFPRLFQSGTLAVVPPTGFRTGHPASDVAALAISPDSKWAASGYSDGTVILWDTGDGSLVRQWVSNDHSGRRALAFSSNSRYLASLSLSDDRLGIWDLSGGPNRVLREHPPRRDISLPPASCAWSPRGDVFACGSHGPTVELWDANTFQRLCYFEHKGSAIYRIDFVNFSPNGRWLLVGCTPGNYYLWDVAYSAGQQLMPVVPYAHNIPIAGAFDSSSTCFAVTSPRGMVEIWKIKAQGTSSDLIPGGGVGEQNWDTMDVAFSPDGTLVLTVPSYRSLTDTIKIWDAHTGVKLLSLEGHEGEVLKACFSPCGKYVASASWDHTVRLWRTSDGSCIATLCEHNSAVFRVGFSPDGKALVSGAEDGSVIVRQMHDVVPKDEVDSE